jgi:hypothetical protein
MIGKLIKGLIPTGNGDFSDALKMLDDLGDYFDENC